MIARIKEYADKEYRKLEATSSNAVTNKEREVSDAQSKLAEALAMTEVVNTASRESSELQN